MTENKILIPNSEPAAEVVDMRLDDARRVKSLSPGMLVFKRFIRNKLAVVGMVILVLMFIFSFLGPVFSPYEQDQVFTYLSTMSKDYAGAIFNQELRYSVAEGESFSGSRLSQFLFALGQDESTFTVDGTPYYINPIGEGSYNIIMLEPLAEVASRVGQLTPIEGASLPEGIEAAYQTAQDQGETSFELDGEVYHIVEKDRITELITNERNLALATLNIYDAYKPENVPVVDSYKFKLASEQAIAANENTFSVDDQTFTLDIEEGEVTILDSTGEPYAEVSEIIVNPLDQSEFLSVEFKSALREAIREREEKLVFTHENGETIEYVIERVNQNYYIKKEMPTTLIDMYKRPSAEHPLGLDNNGMDNLTRLMYGGRISLMVGFVVVILEVAIGVVIGGIAGFFGGHVDTALMRVVDLFNSIPFWPIVIIFGSVMDTLKMDPYPRIFLLMAVLGILGWVGIARVVRGQILSLREQDFMIAAEATGIRTSRRIFRHLIPNVMPLLIVQATMGLGGVIITEATLGFLGLGVKFPLASWGSIINVASDPYVMTNFWFMWIPAGTLILLTVLGFNFVGDGLRDAFDPKMKR
ncbi:MAG: ABC transporter permease [Chloroflexota bacterium]|nr:ABC transporter permease [Chloroflexota bacterium]